MSTNAQRKALIIGISDYTNLERLDFCKNDGAEVYEVLSSLGYEISDKYKLVDEAKGDKVKNAIYDFFDDIRNNPDDTLLFYYSGHVVLDADGDMYLASSDIDPRKPYRRGFSFDELRKMMQKSVSTRVVVILDCCYSGSAKVSKENEDVAKIGRKTMEEKSKKLLEGQGRYILSASQSHEEAYALTTDEHSIFTYYLLQGLEGDTESIDSEGNVTPQSLGKYVYRAIMNLPLDKRPRQIPITRTEESGNVILASYPELKLKKIEEILASMLKLLREGNIQDFNKIREEYSAVLPMPDFSMENLHGAHIVGANLCNANLKRIDLSGADLEGTDLSKTNCNNTIFEAANLSNTNLAKDNLYRVKTSSEDLQQAKANGEVSEPTKMREATVRKRILRSKSRVLLAVLATTVAVLLTLVLFDYNHSSATTTTSSSLPIKRLNALYDKGDVLLQKGNYTGAIKYLDKVLAMDPKNVNALTDRAAALDDSGSYTQAILYYNKALAIDSHHINALIGKGLALYNLRNYTGAILNYNKALAIDSHHINALIGKAIS
jgi:uncharacterized protein YjbI with pentapeptide repeats